MSRVDKENFSSESNKTKENFIIDIDKLIYNRIRKSYYLKHTFISDFGQIISKLYNNLRVEDDKESIDKLDNFIDYFFKGIDKEEGGEARQVEKLEEGDNSKLDLYEGLLELISVLKDKSDRVILDFLDTFVKVPDEEQLNYITATKTIIKADEKFKNNFNNLSKLIYATDIILSLSVDKATKIEFFNKLFLNIININNLIGINDFFTQLGVNVKELKVINRWLFRRRLESLPTSRLEDSAIKDNKEWLYKSLEVNTDSNLGKSIDKLYDHLKGWNNKEALDGFEDFISNLLYRAKKRSPKGIKNSMNLLNIFQDFDGASLEDYERLFSTISSFKKVNYNITFNWLDAFIKMSHISRVNFIKATDLLLGFAETGDGKNLVDFEYTVTSILDFKMLKQKNLLLNRFLELVVECKNRYEVNDILDKIGVSNGRHINRRILERGLKELNNR